MYFNVPRRLANRVFCKEDISTEPHHWSIIFLFGSETLLYRTIYELSRFVHEFNSMKYRIHKPKLSISVSITHGSIDAFPQSFNRNGFVNYSSSQPLFLVDKITVTNEKDIQCFAENSIQNSRLIGDGFLEIMCQNVTGKMGDFYRGSTINNLFSFEEIRYDNNNLFSHRKSLLQSSFSCVV